MIKQQSHRPAEILREYNGALYVENGSIVPRSGTVKTASGGTLLGVKLIGGRDTDLYAIDSVTGELHGFMPKPPRKQTMQNSYELAESHRSLTVTDEVNIPTAQTEIHAKYMKYKIFMNSCIFFCPLLFFCIFCYSLRPFDVFEVENSLFEKFVLTRHF